MKISKLQKFAGVIFALALGTTTLFAQGYGNGNRGNNNSKGTCIEQVSDLTETQKTQIEELQKSHQESMAELRDSRRATTDAIEKNEIKGVMLKKVKAHREEVKNLLTADQQKEYDLLHANGNNYRGNRGGNQGQQFANNNRGGCQGNRAGYRNGNGNNRQNASGCQGNRGKGRKGNRNKNGCGYGNGNGNGNNTSNS